MMPTNIPELLQQQGCLARIPQPVLQQCLEPVMQSLQEMDAMALLHLEASPNGPFIRQGYVGLVNE